MNTNTQAHLTKALSEIETFLTKAVSRIEALQPGERLPVSRLADELAAERGTTRTAVMPILTFLLTGYPGVERRAGRFGGVVKLPVEDTQASNQ